MPDIRLRSFGPGDFGTVIDWFPSADELRDFAGPGVTWPLDTAQLDARLREPDVTAWSAHLAGEVVGHVELERLSPTAARMDRVAIAPAHRGRGLAADLVDVTLAEARSAGYASVDLLVFAANEPAVRTYVSAGFVDVGPISPDHPDVRRMLVDLPSDS